MTRRRSAIGISTLTSVHQAVDAPLNRSESVGVAILVCGSGGCISTQIEAQFVHPVGMALALKASGTEIVVLANGAVVANSK